VARTVSGRSDKGKETRRGKQDAYDLCILTRVSKHPKGGTLTKPGVLVSRRGEGI